MVNSLLIGLFHLLAWMFVIGMAGNKGGKARAAKLTEIERKEIAKKAALKRWAKLNPVHSLK
jgi:hypothetical protein